MKAVSYYLTIQVAYQCARQHWKYDKGCLSIQNGLLCIAAARKVPPVWPTQVDVRRLAYQAALGLLVLP